MRAWTARTAMAMGLASGLLGAQILYSDSVLNHDYQRAASSSLLLDRPSPADIPVEGGARVSVDWKSLYRQNRSVAAWVSVSGTHIDYPVVMPPAEDLDHYLDHDFWGRASPAGCPFLDHRATADGLHALVYGHHMGSEQTMFTDVYACHEQEAFDVIGALRWSTPLAGTIRMKPLCALSASSTWEPIQRFSFSGVEDLRQWLGQLCQAAQATSADKDDIIAHATQAVTLATCSSVVPGQDARTLVVFVATDEKDARAAISAARASPSHMGITSEGESQASAACR